ncbi:2-oxo-4-hydroxy-4-carboxy-5-ureidoimidazoline decarboxylase [Sphaerisporangium album]|uniref:2-oxo-4-hydroxy-4-carboxy-5-ureidoimidazoline decarboxylase n=1 Tax=Sphaerisporangium album TaxID=509200 RepID=A0A367FER0_9ACTN|nr:2-oxo-4-hydroxy-4-carboxy-5-ureidoimidazoline decarboxylase [Sphaerisporangium album]RCG28332.1 2-oxo-4-hydroxy-4-carboxy-5-ureidoimidazoline decarboxylase [Sphaerisporangium album]
MPNVTPAQGLAGFNALSPPEAERELLACCASRAFARGVAAGRPYDDETALTAAAVEAVRALAWQDVQEALDAHPRIGERASGPARESSWSRQEQSGTAGADRKVLAALAAGNARYEERFGHVYLVCATGLTAEEMLDRLEGRLGNDETAERAVVREELAAITRLRVARLLAAPDAGEAGRAGDARDAGEGR